jgi:cytochrome oxidase assembly protein ShyY1
MSAVKASLLFLPSAVAATMAAWQVQRMQWKVRHVTVAAPDLAQHCTAEMQAYMSLLVLLCSKHLPCTKS